MKPLSLLGLVLPALATVAIAQTPDHLVGITRNLPNLRHVSHAPCAALGQCPIPMPNSAALPPWVGGTGWDPRRSGAWVSNGLLLAKVDDNCGVQCPPMPIPTLGPVAFITGIEVVEGLDQVWLIDSAFNLHRYTNTCPPNPLGVCNIAGPVIQPGVTTGLAVDELQGLVFVSAAQFPGGPSRVLVSQFPNPCQLISQFPVPACAVGFGPVLGLACDYGNQILYATDGVGTVAMNYAFVAPNIVLGAVTCCALPAPAVDVMIGLAVRPGRATSVGQSCANGSCPPCPQVHSLLNDPCLGNAQFSLALDQAPSNALALLAVGAGPCLVPGPVALPLCGPLHTIPLLGTLGPNLTGGGFTPCDGSTVFNIPLPVAPGLAGQVLSTQAVTICFGGGALGFGMSNCLSWQIQGN
jgi:hypothetical protein